MQWTHCKDTDLVQISRDLYFWFSSMIGSLTQANSRKYWLSCWKGNKTWGLNTSSQAGLCLKRILTGSYCRAIVPIYSFWQLVTDTNSNKKKVMLFLYLLKQEISFIVFCMLVYRRLCVIQNLWFKACDWMTWLK